jgi:hypothetical protein
MVSMTLKEYSSKENQFVVHAGRFLFVCFGMEAFKVTFSQCISPVL